MLAIYEHKKPTGLTEVGPLFEEFLRSLRLSLLLPWRGVKTGLWLSLSSMTRWRTSPPVLIAAAVAVAVAVAVAFDLQPLVRR